MNVTIFLVTMCDKRNDVLLSNSFCECFVIVESELFYLRHPYDMSIVSSFLKDLISECEFIHALTISTYNKTNREVLSASNDWLFACCSKSFCLPFCDTFIYFFLDADRFIHWCNDTALVYFKVEMRTALIVIAFGIINFTFPSGLIPFALMFSA